MTLQARSAHNRAPVNHTGSHRPSQVSNRLRSVSHVASGSRPRAMHRWFQAPARAKFPRSPSAISGVRREKRPLTRRCKAFTVRHRLRQSLPASGYPPLMVELFSPDRRPCHGPVSTVAGRELPTPARLNEPHETSTRLCCRAAMVRTPWEGFSPSWTTAASTRVEVGPCRPSFEETKTVSDRTSGLLSPHRLPYEGSMIGKDYADEPPSNRTSHSHGIRLYGSAPLRVVNSAPLVEVVSFDLPGGAAHLSNVSNAPRL
jgi:hypothetical protein